MVRFFSILLECVWEILNVKIPIDDGVNITPISIIVFTVVISLIVNYVKARGEKIE